MTKLYFGSAISFNPAALLTLNFFKKLLLNDFAKFWMNWFLLFAFEEHFLAKNLLVASSGVINLGSKNCITTPINFKREFQNSNLLELQTSAPPVLDFNKNIRYIQACLSLIGISVFGLGDGVEFMIWLDLVQLKF